MNILVFATHDITPEQWANFTKDASILPPTHYSGAPTTPLALYVLVYSRSQGDYVSRTGNLSAAVKTEFDNATYFEISNFIDEIIAKLSEQEVRQIHKKFFIIHDEQSVRDGKVMIIHKDIEWVDGEGNVDKDGLMEDDEVTKRSVWKIHRVPYNKTVDFWSLLSVKPGAEGEEFLEEVVRPTSE